jgi:Helix-hairpin-helix motif
VWLRRPVRMAAAALLCGVASIQGAALAADAVDPGQQTLRLVCGSKCHQVELFATARKGYQEWHETVQQMIDRGADGTEEQLQEVMDYLFRTQTIIDVNATAEEDLAIVLEIPAAQAKAIVARRAKKKFASLDDLKSVSGLDPARVDAKSAFLSFQ